MRLTLAIAEYIIAMHEECKDLQELQNNLGANLPMTLLQAISRLITVMQSKPLPTSPEKEPATTIFDASTSHWDVSADEDRAERQDLSARKFPGLAIPNKVCARAP